MLCVRMFVACPGAWWQEHCVNNQLLNGPYQVVCADNAGREGQNMALGDTQEPGVNVSGIQTGLSQHSAGPICGGHDRKTT